MSDSNARPSKLQRSLAAAQAGILMLGLLSMSLPATAFAQTDVPNLGNYPTDPDDNYTGSFPFNFPLITGSLTVNKVVDNTGGGTAKPSDFTFTVKALTFAGFTSNHYAFTDTDATHGSTTLSSLPFGIYWVKEDATSTYTATYGGDCMRIAGWPDFSFQSGLSFNFSRTCTITNTYHAPAPPKTCTYVSDATTQLDTAGYAVTETPNGAWTSIPGASWIWGDAMTNAEAAAGSTFNFVKTFNVTGAATASTSLDIASDNGYRVSVNGHLIDDQSTLEKAYNPAHHYVIPATDLVEGDNQLQITVVNLPGGDATSNPAGLLYKLSVTAPTCGDGAPIKPPAPQPGHLIIEKHVVNDGGGTKVASDFTFHVIADDAATTDVTGSPFKGSETGTTLDLPAGDYSISEDQDPRYTTDFTSPSCAGGHVHLGAGQTVDCNVTNTYVPPPSCTIVSDNTTQVNGHDSVVLSELNAAWTHLLDATGARWIWGEEPLADPTQSETETFTKVIHVNGTPDSAYVDIAADNGFQVRVNGNLVADQLATENNYSGTTTVPLTGLNPNADNTIEFTVKNFALAGGTQATNPAGLDYAIHVNNSTCSVPDPHQSATVIATKIVCDNESDLPNLQGSHHTTDANTAADFLKAHPSCHLQSGWQFEWANQNGGNPGGSYVGHADGYTASGPTDANGQVSMTIPLSGVNSIHMREQLQSGYVPFSDSSSDVSAELSCADDGLNYDNWEWINNPQAGHTYYCVAFNAPQTSTVKMCKTDDTEAHTPLPGWNLFLKGASVGSVSVKPDGTNYSVPNVPAGSYLVTASGQYIYRPGDASASTSDAAYSLRLPTDSVYGGPYKPWVRENDFPAPITGWLGIMMDNAFTDWGNVFNPDHVYALGTTTTSTGNLSFKILDDNYTDNSGSISVDVSKGFDGVTGEDGCVTFSNVPYGTYAAGELNQSGWTPVTGAGSFTVNQPNQTITLVNHQGSQNNGGGEPTTSSETVVVHQADLESNIVNALGNDKWFEYNDSNDTIDNTLGSFVTGPGTPPAGQGSIEFSLAATPLDRKNIATYQFGGTPLADIKTLAFSAYSHSGVAGAHESPYLVFNVDLDHSGTWQKRLVYVPSANGSVPQDTWNTFDAIDGGNALWTWSGYYGNGNKWPDGNTSEYRTWSDIMSAWPNARVAVNNGATTQGFMGVRVGEPGPAGYTGDVDKFVIGITTGTNTDTKTFDFEPTDLCSNIPGVQTSTDGYLVNGTTCTATGTLHIVKVVKGGPYAASHFSFSLDNGSTTAFEADGTNDLTVAAGVHNVAEGGHIGYTVAYDNCANVNVPAGGDATCTITNTYSAGGPPQIFTWTDGGGGSGQPHGQVLGESTTTVPSCEPLLSSYLKLGWKNDPDQVKALQQFLANYLKITLPTTGFFGTLTENAVKQFQLKEWESVLKPWFGVPGSGITGQDTPTGFVYQTTKWRINNLFCDGSESFPDILK